MSSSHSGKLAGKSLGLTQSPCSRQTTLSPAVAAVWVTTAPDGPAPMTSTSTTSAASLRICDVTIHRHFLSDSRPGQHVDDESGSRDRSRVIRQQERDRTCDLDRFDGAANRLKIRQAGFEGFASAQG